MKKSIIALLSLLVLLAAPAVSLEWGGVVKSETDYITADFNDFSIEEIGSVYLWFRTPFGKNSTFSLTGEGVYKGDVLFEGSSTTIKNILDVDLFKVGGTLFMGKSSALELSLGRFNVADNAYTVFTQLIDGAQFIFTLPFVKLSAFGGFTGFINSHETVMMDNSGIIYAPDTNIYSKNIPYFPVEAKIEFPVIFKNQSLTLEALAFFDPFSSFTINRYFGELSFTGPVANNVFYKLTTVVGTTDFANFSNYTSIMYNYFPMDNFMINFGAEYASGAHGGPIVDFTTVTARSAYQSYALTGVVMPVISATISTKNFYSVLKGKFVFSIPEKEFQIVGPEVNFTAQVNIFSDFKIIADATYFYDMTGSNETNFTAGLTAAISF